MVLVNPDNTLVAQVAALGPDWIQLHGPETPHRVEAIRDEAGIAIIKACSIGDRRGCGARSRASPMSPTACCSTPSRPRAPTGRAGSASTFDWALLKALDPELPFMLSGGLTPDTVAAAIKAVRPMGVDVSSGVETAPGVKDAALIRAFIANARAAARELS